MLGWKNDIREKYDCPIVILGVIHISLWVEKGIWGIKTYYFVMNSKLKIKLGIKFLIIQNHTFFTVYVKVARKKCGHAAPPDTICPA